MNVNLYKINLRYFLKGKRMTAILPVHATSIETANIIARDRLNCQDHRIRKVEIVSSTLTATAKTLEAMRKLNERPAGHLTDVCPPMNR